jgi:hypothetical protein
MDVADKDLWHRASPIGTLDHLGFSARIAQNIKFRERDAFLGQKALGSMAEPAKR